MRDTQHKNFIGKYRPFVVAVCAALLAGGCSRQVVASPGQLVAFQKIGRALPKSDGCRPVEFRRNAGFYRVVAGDMLRLEMPDILRAVSTRPSRAASSLSCRVDASGDIELPMKGTVKVVGKTLGEIELIIAAIYYPKYVTNPPLVLAKVAEYRTKKVFVTGGVVQPGVYDLRSDEMFLSALLMKAGGIVKRGADTIAIRPEGQTGDDQTVNVTVMGGNMLVTDIVLAGGETVEVDECDQQFFTVIGLVNNPGIFPYPPSARYNLINALALAGDLKEIEQPRYVTVYRRSNDGRKVSVVFDLKDNRTWMSSRVFIKPYDVVFVKPTFNTRFRKVVAHIFKMSSGVFVGANYNPLSPT